MARVMVAMSGGVDSSVAALLLLQQGHEVAGVTLKLHDGREAGEKSTRTCCSLDDIDDAKRVAGTLGIAHYVFNYEDAFVEQVIDPFVRTYCLGQTPNPCILCNRFIKFDKLLVQARALGFDYVATGHYAGIRQDEDGRRILIKPKDLAKDQTYFLYAMTQEQLGGTLFPLHALIKGEARRLAAAHGLITARKRDSQDICFIPDGDHGRFIDAMTDGAGGDFVDAEGNRLGTHRGIWHYTIGQRRGLGLGGLTEPLYVVDIRHEENQVVLGPPSALFSEALQADHLNWIRPLTQGQSMRVNAKIRAAHTPAPARVTLLPDETAEVVFDEAVRAVSPGQAVVFYDGDDVAGGGTITDRTKIQRGRTQAL